MYINFEDGSIEPMFTIVESSVTPDRLLQTGDKEYPTIYLMMAMAALAALGYMTKKRK